jgi:hypothetical protein
MIWDRFRDWLDNPIFIKHVRSRLRPQPFFTSLAVVVILCLCIALGGYRLDAFKTGGASGTLLALQTVLLVIMGSSQVSAAVNGARASGILDFHRVSPLTPTAMTLGFFFGAPIREYLLVAATLPFTAICMAFGVPSLRGFVQLLIVLLVTAWTFQGLTLLNSLISKAKNPTGGVVGLIVFVLFFSTSLITGGTYSANMVENDHRLSFYGISLPWLPVVLLYQVPFLFFIFLAARRKMESARIHPLSKPQELAAMVTFATLVLGGIWRQENPEILRIVALYLLVVTGILLTIMVTPSQAEYYKGLWRARKLGRSRLPWWNDLSVNWVCLAITAGLVLAAGTIAWSAPGGSEAGTSLGRPWGSFPLALATGVLVVAYFGLALQFFLLRFAGRGRMYFALFLFLVWLLPLVGGMIQVLAVGGPGGSGERAQAGYYFFSISPLAGIAMTAAIGDEAYRYEIQAAAITPALLFTFVFNSLLITARRRVLKAVLIAAAKTKEPASPEDRQADDLEGIVPGAETTRLGAEGA